MHELGTSKRPDWSLAVVVGAGGLGAAVARRLGQHHRLLIADIDKDKADEVAQRMRDEGGDAEPVHCDITRPESVLELAEEVKRRGGFAALAHVAGLSPSAADFESIVRVNLTGAALVTRALLPCAEPGAAAVLIASLAAHTVTPSPAAEAVLRDPHDARTPTRLKEALGEEERTPAMAYQLSKHGLLSLCRREAWTWGQRGARIVSLSPGLIATPMGAFEFAHSPVKHDLYVRTPLARECTMIEIAGVVAFLASDQASFISGTDILVDGGLAGTLRGD
ncbi:SDR family oxidoreductase [Streptomyces sp. NPDC054770]